MEILAFLTAIIIVGIYGASRKPDLKNKNELTVSYPVGPGAKWQRNLKEKKILKDGFKIVSEENIKEWDAIRLFYLVIPIFLPLVFFKSKKVKVIYKK